jgi:uncharacterized membrane protein
MTAGESAPASRLAFLDGLRGAALILMVVNHTARWWIDTRMTVGRYALIYVTLTLAAPIFLFLVGFCLVLGRAQAAGVHESLVALSRRLGPRGGRIVLAGLVLNLAVFRSWPVACCRRSAWRSSRWYRRSGCCAFAGRRRCCWRWRSPDTWRSS